MMGNWMTALALVLLLEGLLPLAAPALWRDAFRRATEMSDDQLRWVGAISMASGLIMLLMFR
jgi:uncharacterized protein